MDRQSLANLWRDAAQITRQDIFGSEDKLLPVYPASAHELALQAQLPAVGMVGPDYSGSLVILSVNGAGGKFDHRSHPSSDRMYDRIGALKASTHGPTALEAFEALNNSIRASMPDWSIYQRHTSKILQAARHELADIAYLYVVPFRTKNDEGYKILRRYREAAYSSHLIHQLQALEPKTIIAIDRSSEQAALQFKADHPDTNLIYYTRQRDAHDEQKRTLTEIAKFFQNDGRHQCS
ncbi:MAG: hypothetical protein R2853_13005 [Thermomicrobiales bacterium]